jgi:hypothetical protein
MRIQLLRSTALDIDLPATMRSSRQGQLKHDQINLQLILQTNPVASFIFFTLVVV